jgi:hypothetical protein
MWLVTESGSEFKVDSPTTFVRNVNPHSYMVAYKAVGLKIIKQEWSGLHDKLEEIGMNHGGRSRCSPNGKLHF